MIVLLSCESIAVTATLLAALFIYDAILFAHRIVGPLYRLRVTMRAITEGKELGLMQLRKDDFLQELKDEFNEMLRALEQRGAVVLTTTEAPAEVCAAGPR